VDAWYVEHVDRGAHAPGPDALTHFVINTNQNGRGPLDPTVYGRPPYNQPPNVVSKLRDGSWCMPPGRGLGPRPTASANFPLVDAFLWIDRAGVSVATCDKAGGARDWDFTRYNPWHVEGETGWQHFDPLWEAYLPPVGAWFPQEALQLARLASPPLGTPLAAAPADVRPLSGGHKERPVATSDRPAPAAAASRHNVDAGASASAEEPAWPQGGKNPYRD
jgi:endoglucanase